jgi:hypothetical protein
MNAVAVQAKAASGALMNRGLQMSNENVESEILERLKLINIFPLVGGLIPEKHTADLLGYAPSYFRKLAANGTPVIPFILRGNRRFYKTGDIAAFVSKTVQ